MKAFATGILAAFGMLAAYQKKEKSKLDKSGEYIPIYPRPN